MNKQHGKYIMWKTQLWYFKSQAWFRQHEALLILMEEAEGHAGLLKHDANLLHLGWIRDIPSDYGHLTSCLHWWEGAPLQFQIGVFPSPIWRLKLDSQHGLYPYLPLLLVMPIKELIHLHGCSEGLKKSSEQQVFQECPQRVPLSWFDSTPTSSRLPLSVSVPVHCSHIQWTYYHHCHSHPLSPPHLR